MSIYLEKFINTKKNNYTVERNNFSCIKIHPEYSDEKYKELIAKASELSKKMNSGSANKGTNRSENEKFIDVLYGILAECAANSFFKYVFGKGFSKIPSSVSSYNQIDLKLFNGMTIEVRSSFVKNGIDFALFALDSKTNLQYFDIIGPYKNDVYKSSFENQKDFYLRVLYAGDINNYNERTLLNDDFFIYIIGGANRKMMTYNSIQKEMNSQNSTEIKKSGIYNVIPISQGLDIVELVNDISSQTECNVSKEYISIITT